MNHIFGDSHDITFGFGDSHDRTQENTPAPVPTRTYVHDNFDDLMPASERKPAPIIRTPRPDTRTPITPKAPMDRSSTPPAPRREEAPIVHDRIAPRPIQSRDTPAPVARDNPTPPLSRLISGMKSSFLPREDDATTTRMVLLSESQVKDPLFLIRRDDTTILMGSGFQEVVRAGVTYPAFPDMRLIFSEKDRLRGWILTDAMIDVTVFRTLLPTLGFPQIYATREVIAKFRDTIQDTEFLASCRFFELFVDGTGIRQIGDIVLHALPTDDHVSLALSTSGLMLSYPHTGLTPVAQSDAPETQKSITLNADGYSIASEQFVRGEILTIRDGQCTRHTMKFTFDTFFVDGLSVGVQAGYTLGDRAQMAESGVLMFTLEEDVRARTIAGHIFIDSRGFVHAHEMMHVHKEILKWIRSTYEKMITENPRIPRGDLVQWLRREITKYCYVLTGRTPIVMPILIERESR